MINGKNYHLQIYIPEMMLNQNCLSSNSIHKTTKTKNKTENRKQQKVDWSVIVFFYFVILYKNYITYNTYAPLVSEYL